MAEQDPQLFPVLDPALVAPRIGSGYPEPLRALRSLHNEGDAMLDAFKTNGASPPADLTVQNEGSIFILRGRTETGKDWIEDHCDEGDYNPFGHGARLVEHGLRVEMR